jgi:hypothetical protein
MSLYVVASARNRDAIDSCAPSSAPPKFLRASLCVRWKLMILAIGPLSPARLKQASGVSRVLFMCGSPATAGSDAADKSLI